MLTPELSLLAFQQRVLALAEDPRTPLRARLRFIGIVASNIDELYMVRMPGLVAAAGGGAPAGADGLTARERLACVRDAIAQLTRAQATCAEACLAAAREEGTEIVSWQQLTAPEQTALTKLVTEEILPALTPLAMTLSPGHPLPHLPHLGLSLAVVFRRSPGDTPHVAESEIPADLPRLIPVPGRGGVIITLEELLRVHAQLLHPNVILESAHLFRVTRIGALSLDEENAESLLDAVAVATELRSGNPAIRVEVEATMPAFAVSLVLESLRREAAGHAPPEVQQVPGMLDLRCLASVPLPENPRLEYAPLARQSVFDEDEDVFARIRDGDVLVHHPFESFDGSVVRFIRDAAHDAHVHAIRITLYRVGDPSAIVAHLLDAAREGKRVYAFVELKARFDEQHNVGWARALEQAGGHVVYGIVGIKAHAKVAMVVRHEDGRPRRYVHVSTGNYNARSGSQYTDLSLFSAREALVADVNDLFNELLSSSQAPQRLSRGALVAPHQMLDALLARIAREARNARDGRAASITIKVNGLSDPEIVKALSDASEAGVDIALVVRGICTLRPGVPGVSSRVRVVSVVGRFLEHSRIYRFHNAGDAEYFIGSSDLRPRNLRRRVELLVPVTESQHKSRLGDLLASYLNDPTAWELGLDGSYRHRGGQGGTQEQLALPRT